MRWVLVVVVLASACGARAAAPPRPPLAEDSAVAGAKAVVDEALRAIRSGDSDDVLSLARQDLLTLGPRELDSYDSLSDAVLALREHLERKRRPALTTSSAPIFAGPGGHSAYVAGKMALRGTSMTVVGLLDGDGGIWRISALGLARPLAAGAVRRASKQGTLTATATKPPPGTRAGQPQAETALRRALEQPPALASLLGGAGGALLAADGTVLSAPKRRAQLEKYLARVRYQLDGALSSVSTSDGQLAFVSAAGRRGLDGAEPQAVRLCAILRRDGAGWALVVLQEAQAVAAPAPAR